MKNYRADRNLRYKSARMQIKYIVPAAGALILGFIAVTAVYAERSFLEVPSEGSEDGLECNCAGKGINLNHSDGENPPSCGDSRISLDPEKFFQEHSWILPIEKPTNPKSEWAKSEFRPISLKFDCQTHTPVRAVADGKVLFSGWYGGWGRVIIINHDAGLATLYAHLSRSLVSKDEDVLQGQNIAFTGSTGFSTKPGRLHFEIRKKGKPLVWDRTSGKSL